MKLFFQLVFLCFALNLNAQSQHEIEVQGQIDSIMTLYPNCTDYPNDVLVVLDSLLVLLAEIQGDSTNPNLDSISTDYFDAAFLDFLSTNYPNVIQNEQIDPLEASLIIDLDLDDLGISCLNGIEHFINLKTLSCQHNNLTSLPNLPSQIESVNCQWNEIAFLYPLPESLRNFDIRHNSMTIVPELPNFIEDLKLCFNNITAITNLPDSLEILYCAYNNLIQLPDFPSKLKTVLCYNNEIAQISAIPESMRTFRIQNNSLIALPTIPSGLETLAISNNPIECVNDYPDQFEDLLGQYPNCERDLIYQISQAIEPWYISIALQEGWNMFGYACPEPNDVEALLSPYVSSIILLKDNNGSAYIPEFAYNGIGDFTPGHGYQLKTSEFIQSFSLCDWYVVVLPEDNILAMQEYISQLEDSIEILNQPLVPGCTDETAFNYNSSANMDDGSCIIYGCTNPYSQGGLYNPLANVDDGSCILIGCADSMYLEYYTQGFTPSISEEVYNDLFCSQLAVFGCTDNGWLLNAMGEINDSDLDANPAVNYNPDANIDDGSCITESIGCTDSSAFNYNSSANVDDGSCYPIIYGCLDPTAFNFNDFDFDGLSNVMTGINGVDVNTSNGSCYPIVGGCLDSSAFNFNDYDYDGYPNAIIGIYGIDVNTDSGNCIPKLYGCIDCTEEDGTPIANNCVNNIIIANTDDGSCEYIGCMDSLADNYDPVYTVQVSEMCVYHGCLDILACNYNPESNIADGSCTYPEQGYDCDGNINVQVGDEAFGGIVFYVDSTGQHGLVAAMEDLDTTYQWGCFATSILGADGQAIGTGYQNTLDIVSGCSETPIAASEALAYESKAYSDWYLPSLDELKEIYNTIGYGGLEGNIGGFSSNWYWSSSENNNYGALDVDFGDGSTGNFSAKLKTDRVRVIRSF